MGINTKGDLTESEKQFIRDHFKKMPIRQLTRRLQRGAKSIYDFVKADGFSQVDGQRDTRNHPWRRANHQLEIYKLSVKEE